MKTDFTNELDPELHKKLWLLRDVPLRDPKVKASQRAHYLAQLKQLPARQNSVGLLAYWPFSIFTRKHAPRQMDVSASWHMSFGKVCTAVVLVLIFAFGSLGVTAYAAQGSLPSSPIYPFKLITEDLRLQLTTNEEIKFDLALNYANKRVEEIAALQFQGVTVEEPVISRLQHQYEFAFELASGMPDDQMAQSLEQLRETTQIQLTTMTSLLENVPIGLGDQLGRAQQVLEQQQVMAQNGLDDPTAFRQIISNRNRHGAAGNGNQIGFSDEPDPSSPSVNGQVLIPPKGRGPSHDLKEPVPAPAPPGEDDQKEDAPGTKGEDEPGNGAKPEDPGKGSEPEDPGKGSGPGDPGKGPGPGGSGNSAGFTQNNPVETQGSLFSNSTGFFAQYGDVVSPDRRSGYTSKFSGSAIFVP